MLTITLQINNDVALDVIKDLETKHFVSVLEKSDVDTPALSGAALSIKEFRSWIQDAEQTSTLSLSEANATWEVKRKQLQQLIG
jgi:hypothetical protein